MNISLLDDNVNGDRIYTYENMQMINLHRDSDRIKQYKNAAMYILLGPNQQKRQIYIGQTSNICRRIAQHQKKKDFWTECIFFKHERELTKTETEWLESQMIQLFMNNNQFDILTNYQIPTNITINEENRPGLNKILEAYKLMLNTFYSFRLSLNNPIEKNQVNSNSIINRIAKAYKQIPDYYDTICEETEDTEKHIVNENIDVRYGDCGCGYMISKGSKINKQNIEGKRYDILKKYKDKISWYTFKEKRELVLNSNIIVDNEEQAKLIIGI